MIHVDIIDFQSEISRYLKYVTEFNQPVIINTGDGNVIIISETTYVEMEELIEYAKEERIDSVLNSYNGLKNRKTTWNDVIEFYMNLPYKIDLVTNRDGTVTALHPELTNCMACGDDESEAKLLLHSARRGWITAALRDGTGIPIPANETVSVTTEMTLEDLFDGYESDNKTDINDVEFQDLVNYYMSLNHEVQFVDDRENGNFFAFHPALRGCIVHAADRDSAMEALYEAKKEWIVSALRDGIEIPEPKRVDDKND